jgi:hypothetical protein
MDEEKEFYKKLLHRLNINTKSLLEHTVWRIVCDMIDDEVPAQERRILARKMLDKELDKWLDKVATMEGVEYEGT